MQFHLNYKPAVSPQKITHQDRVLFMGSCFSEHICFKLSDHKFNVDSNPFGIIFNPISIANAITRILDRTHFTERDVMEHDEKWISLQSHSSVSAPGKDELLHTLNDLVDEWHEKLKTAQWLVITFGTAYAYKHLEQNALVANCHKLPQALFEKQLLELPGIVSEFEVLLNRLQQFNPMLKILFTVSPVKHLRDGVVENNLSKSILIQSVHTLIKRNEHCSYFPAYEIVSDDLRDYRFYESDMAHPNKQAIDYVWKLFSGVYFTDVTNAINEKVLHIHQAYHHRLIDKTTSTSVKFKHNFHQKCATLQAEYPYLNLSKELKYFNTFED